MAPVEAVADAVVCRMEVLLGESSTVDVRSSMLMCLRPWKMMCFCLLTCLDGKKMLRTHSRYHALVVEDPERRNSESLTPVLWIEWQVFVEIAIEAAWRLQRPTTKPKRESTC